VATAVGECGVRLNPLPIAKGSLLRLLLMYARGGTLVGVVLSAAVHAAVRPTNPCTRVP
jgi:hypothetical protein